MTLPPWKSDDPADQRALSEYIIRELDRLDERASADATDNGDFVERVQLYLKLRPLAQAAGLSLSPPFTAPEPGRGRPVRDPSSDGFTDFDRAALDVPRIRDIFVRDYQQRNRMQRPRAEEIAAERWSLTAEQTGQLIDQFQRKP